MTLTECSYDGQESGGAEGIRTLDPLLAKQITRLLVGKPHLPSYEDAIKAYKVVARQVEC